MPKMGRHFSYVKGLVIRADWKDRIALLVELSAGVGQEAVASLDPLGRVKQKDISRWRRGNYKEEPTEEKLAGLEAVIEQLQGSADRARERNEMAVAAKWMERLAKCLKEEARRPPGGSGSPADDSGKLLADTVRARLAEEKKLRRARGGR